MRMAWHFLALALTASPLAAQTGLPDTAAVQAALDNHPSVLAARARVDAARADARAREHGPHEITVNGSYIRRSVDRYGAFDEFDGTVSRAFRLPGKKALDRAIGKYGVLEAENMAEDARHQAALLLMQQWFGWLGAAAEARIDARAVANYEHALGAVQRRVKLRDAAPLDADQAQAALSAARALAEQSAGRARLARARLEAHFPLLLLPPEAPELPVPAALGDGAVQLRDHVLVNSHEIAAADARADRFARMADRSRADRIADPSLGVRLFSERGGEERGVGMVFSMPFGGGYRRAQADQAQAEASAARTEATLARLTVRETADADLAEAQYRYSAWARSREALIAQMAALEKMRRGYQLGEIDLAELLLSERMAHEAFRNETVAKTEATRAFTRLRIDSHELWLGD